jgi:hypothetical protein
MKKTFYLTVLLGATFVMVLFLLLYSASTQNKSQLPGGEQNAQQSTGRTSSTISRPPQGILTGQPPSREPSTEEIKKRKEETERGPGKESPFPQVGQPEPPTPGSHTIAPK